MPRLEHILGAWMALVMAGCASSAPAPQATPVAGKDLPTQDAICAEWTAVYQQLCHDASSDVARGGKQADFFQVLQTALSYAPRRNWFTRQLNLYEEYDHVYTARGELWFFAAPLAGAVFMECLVLQYLLAWLTG